MQVHKVIFAINFVELSYNASQRVAVQCSFENTIMKELVIINE